MRLDIFAVIILAGARAWAAPAIEELRAQAVRPSPAVAAPAAARAGANATAEYQAAFGNPNWPAARLDKLRRYKILLVPGFMANGILRRWAGDKKGEPVLLADKSDPVADLARDERESKEQFGALRAWLGQSGVEEEVAAINTRQTSAFNARILAQAVAASDKPVLFVTHSKGGKDVLEALLSGGDPTGKVRGWVSIQTPFYGSPVGDFWVGHPAFFKWASKYLIAMGGDPGALIGLTQKDSRAYLAAHQAGVDALLLRLPVVAFASWKDPEGLKFDTKLKVFRDMMLRKGVKNDGMVPVASAELAGADFAAVPGVDHNATVAPTVRPLDRLRFSKALLTLLLSRLP